MAVSINMASIMDKANSFIMSSNGKKRLYKCLDDIINGRISFSVKGRGGIMTPDEVGDLFVHCLHETINNTDGLSQRAKDAISDWDYESPSKLYDGQYLIVVHPASSMERPSLDPSHFGDGITSLDELLDSGVDHTMRQVHGQWHGQEYWSRTDIPRTGFLDQAADDFIANYGADCGIEKIDIVRTHG